jgi:hypothetical protein
MKQRRFGRRINLPSTLQLKHQILRDRFEQAQNAVDEDSSMHVHHPIEKNENEDL